MNWSWRAEVVLGIRGCGLADVRAWTPRGWRRGDKGPMVSNIPWTDCSTCSNSGKEPVILLIDHPDRMDLYFCDVDVKLTVADRFGRHLTYKLPTAQTLEGEPRPSRSYPNNSNRPGRRFTHNMSSRTLSVYRTFKSSKQRQSHLPQLAKKLMWPRDAINHAASTLSPAELRQHASFRPELQTAESRNEAERLRNPSSINSLCDISQRSSKTRLLSSPPRPLMRELLQQIMGGLGFGGKEASDESRLVTNRQSTVWLWANTRSLSRVFVN